MGRNCYGQKCPVTSGHSSILLGELVAIIITIDYVAEKSSKMDKSEVHIFGQPICNRDPTVTDYYKNSFFPKTIRLWNTLPATFAEAPGLVPFKRELSSLII